MSISKKRASYSKKKMKFHAIKQILDKTQILSISKTNSLVELTRGKIKISPFFQESPLFPEGQYNLILCFLIS
jgi:hypothetical protein